MKRFLPHPILAALLLCLWLALQESAGLGHILLGGLVALIASALAAAFIPEPIAPRRPLKLIKLTAVAGLDIIQSNLAVMLILFRPKPNPRPGFVEMQLELTNTFGLAILACLITATPGSAWLEHDRERSIVLIHVFDLDDADEWARTIKARYETLLMEIFQ